MLFKGCLDNVNETDNLRRRPIEGRFMGLFWSLVALLANKLFMFIYKKPLIVQIKTFVRYRPKTIPMDESDEGLLLTFAQLSCKNDISEITREDREKFSEYLRNTVSSGYFRMCAMHKVDALLRYYNFHTKMKLPKKPGRPMALDRQEKALKLVDEGYTYREIQDKAGINISQINKWVRGRNEMEAN